MKIRPTKSAGFTLVEIMIVVLIIGILLAIAIPNFVQARESSRARACVANLKQIDSAVQQSMMDNKLSAFVDLKQAAAGDTGLGDPAAAAPAAGALVPTYIRATPKCPSSGLYETMTGSARPTCTIGANATGGTNNAHVLP